MPPGNLSRPRQNRAAVARDDPEVPPSAMGKSGTPFAKGGIERAIAPVPCIEGAGHKILLGEFLDDRIGKNDSSGVFASLSSAPLCKVCKNGFARLGSNFQSHTQISMTAIRGQIYIINRTQLDKVVLSWFCLLNIDRTF